jgi:hypothetical protein
MTLTPTFFGQIENGQLSFDHRDRFLSHVKSLNGERVVITIGKAETTRTMSQNKYYWSCVVRTLSQHCGYSEGEMHSELKKHFGVESTKTMTLEAFGNYVESVIAWAQTDMGVRLPAPEEVQ